MQGNNGEKLFFQVSEVSWENSGDPVVCGMFEIWRHLKRHFLGPVNCFARNVIFITAVFVFHNVTPILLTKPSFYF